MPSPTLSHRRGAGPPRAVVLMLHGGKDRGRTPVTDSSASWRRSRWMRDRVAEPLNAAGVDVWLLRYAVRGWNGSQTGGPSPVPDARWALDRLREEVGDVPVVLLGHSMGGRTAVAVADDPSVLGVVGLAPWLPTGEPVAALRGRQLAVAHGRGDKITSARQSRAFCRTAEAVAASVEFHDRGRVGHYMLRDVAGWDDFAVSRSLGQLRGVLTDRS